MEKSKSSAGRRLSTITVDQAVSGASNVLIAVLAARILGVASFGLFGIVFIVYVTAQGSLRALVCEPLLVHPEEAQDRPGDAIGTATALGALAGVVVVAAGAVAHVWHSGLGNGLIVLGVCLPFLVLQDLGRYLGFATQRPGRSLFLDVVWLGLMIAAVVVLSVTDRSTLGWFIAAWTGSGALAGLLIFAQHGSTRLHFSLSWLRETWGFSWRYLLAFMSMQGAALATSIGIGAVAGARELGAVRGALLLTRPVGMVHLASVAAGTAEISRLTPGSREVHRHVRLTTLLTTAIALANMVVLLVLPDSVGRAVLGDTWEPAQELLLPATLQVVMIGLICGTRAGLTGMRAVSKTVRIDIATTVLVTLATIIGAVVDGAIGAFWALVVAQGVCAVIWWATYLTHHPAAPPPDPESPDGADSPDAAADVATG